MPTLFEIMIRISLIISIFANFVGIIIIRTSCSCISGEVGLWFTRVMESATIGLSVHGLLLHFKEEYRKALLDYFTIILFQCFILGGISILNQGIWTNINTIYTTYIAIIGLAVGTIVSGISFLLSTATISAEDPK